jgi:hypothetical protein
MMNTVLRAGSGKAVIRITGDMFPLDRFAQVHGELYVRVVLIRCDNSAVIVSVEMTSLTEETVAALKSLVSEKTGLPEDAIWISVTHTFSAPHILGGTMLAKAKEEDKQKNDLLQRALLIAAGEAVSQAAATIRDAVLRIGNGSCDVNNNRDIPSIEGWWLGLNSEGFSDKTLTVMCFDDTGGKTIAVLYHYGVQASVMDGVTDAKGLRTITADLTGEASCVVETALGEQSTVIFLPGASGDQAPCNKAKYFSIDPQGKLIVKERDDGFAIIKELGGRLGASVLKVVQDVCVEADICGLYHSAITVICPKQRKSFEGPPQPTKDFVSALEGEIETTISFLRLGKNIMLLGMKPEINCITALQIKETSPFQRTLVIQMVNGSQKYMADMQSYIRMTYESMNSSFAIGAAEKVCTKIRRVLREVWDGRCS